MSPLFYFAASLQQLKEQEPAQGRASLVRTHYSLLKLPAPTLNSFYCVFSERMREGKNEYEHVEVPHLHFVAQIVHTECLVCKQKCKHAAREFSWMRLCASRCADTSCVSQLDDFIVWPSFCSHQVSLTDWAAVALQQRLGHDRGPLLEAGRSADVHSRSPLAWRRVWQTPGDPAQTHVQWHDRILREAVSGTQSWQVVLTSSAPEIIPVSLNTCCGLQISTAMKIMSYFPDCSPVLGSSTACFIVSSWQSDLNNEHESTGYFSFHAFFTGPMCIVCTARLVQGPFPSRWPL